MSETPSRTIVTIVGVIAAIILMSTLFMYVSSQKDANMSTSKQIAEQGASVEEGRFLQYDGENIDGSEVMAAIDMLNGEGVEILVNTGGRITAMTDAEGKLNGNYTSAKQKGDPAYVSPAQVFTGAVERDDVTGRIKKLMFNVEGGTDAVTPDVAVHEHSAADDALAGTIYISYYKNDGSGGLLEKTSATKNEDMYMTSTRPERSGYAFVGWSLDSGATSPTYVPGQFVHGGFGGNTSVYAVWSVDTYKVTFNLSETNDEIDATESSAFGYDLTTKKYVPFSIVSTENYTIPDVTPTRNGYTFKGWGTRSNGEVLYNNGDMYVGKTSVTLYALWSRNAYTIEYDGNGNTSGNMNTSSVNEGSSLNLTTNKFERDGYRFKGWSLTASGDTVKYADGANVRLTDADVDSNKRLTLYAVWEGINVYSIDYDTDNGTWTEDTSVTINEDELYKIPAKKPTRENYQFKGWSDGNRTYSAGATVQIMKDTNFTAQWKADEHKYVVNYYLCGVNGEEDTEHAKLENTFTFTTTDLSVTPFIYEYLGYVNPVKRAYDVAVDGSTVINLFYQRERYKLTLKTDTGVTINYNDEQVVSDNSKNEIELAYGEVRNFKAIVNEEAGLVFGDWKSDPQEFAGNKASIEFTMPAHNVTLTAHAEGLKYYITYNLNGMKNDTRNKPTFMTNEKTHIYRPSQRGYVFTGWESGNTDSSAVNKHLPAAWEPVQAEVYDYEFDIPVNTRENLTFTAHKRRANFTVKYDANFTGATGTMEDSKFQYDQGINFNDNGVTDSLPKLRKNEFTNDGFTFYGWNTKDDGSGRFYSDEEIVSDNHLTDGLLDAEIDGATITLYAVWYKHGTEAEIVEDKWEEPTSPVKNGTTLDKNPAIQSNVGWNTWGIIRVTVPQYDGADIVRLNGLNSGFTLLHDYAEDGFHVMYYGCNTPIKRYEKSPELFQSIQITVDDTKFQGETSVDVKAFTIEEKYFNSINEVWDADVFR